MNVPDSLAGEDGLVVLNPDAIGDPDQTPKVWVGADIAAVLNPCFCGGVNGYHVGDCPKIVPVEPAKCEHGETGRHGIGVAHPMDSFPIYFCTGPAATPAETDGLD